MKLLLLIILTLFLIACGSPAGGDLEDGLEDGEHRVFVSSESYSGDMGGLSGADDNCQDLADRAGLKKEYNAILSDSFDNAQTRLNISGAIYIFDGVEKKRIASSPGDLWNTDTTSLSTAIMFDEEGDEVNDLVWTGTDSDGNALGDHCDNWGLDTNSGWFGETDKKSAEWTESNFASCSNFYRIYCISIDD
jgi:hypothetical protein